MNTDILEQIYNYSDVDTKVNLRKAFPEYNIRSCKLSKDKFIHIEPWKQLNENREYKIEKCSYDIEYIESYTAYWQSYRCIKRLCHKCCGTSYSTYTCNESDINIPGWLTLHARQPRNPFHANNWLGRLRDVTCEYCEKR